jgi:MFS family permease
MERVGRVRQVLGALGSALRNPNIRRAELAWGAAIAAEWAHFVAFGVYAYDVGGPAAVGVAGLVRLLPAAIIAPFAASLGDRFPRERFLLALTLVASVALGASAIAFVLDVESLVFAFAALLGFAVTLIRPALQALLPSLARTPEELIASNGATSTVESFGTLVGPLLAGVLVSVADAGVVFALGALAFLVGAVLLLGVRVENRVSLVAPGESARKALAAGFGAIARLPRVRLVVSLIFAQAFVRGCLNVLMVVAAFEVLDGGGEAVGYMTAALGVGGLIGALGAMALGGQRLAVPFGISLVFWGLPIALIGPLPDLPFALLMLAVVGAANSVEDVAAFTLLQRLIPDRILTRVFGVVWSLAMAGVALGSVAAPALVRAVGAREAFIAVGAILPLLTLATYRRLAVIDKEAAPVPELEFVQRVPMFQPLSVAAKERVAGNLLLRSVHAGEVVIRAGERGDRFYIVGSGTLEITAEGLRTTADEGDYFGEIALLRDVPRTATVTALVDTRLYVLQRDDFLAAVTGHEAAHAAGQSIADERLSRMPEASDPSA